MGEARGAVDQLLEEFKVNKPANFCLRDVSGHVFAFSLDQFGSRFIQQQLDGPDGAASVPGLLSEVMPRLVELSCDIFGNYVVQKALDVGDAGARAAVASALAGDMLSLSLNQYGCRVVQKALQVLPEEGQVAIVSELDSQVMRCVRDANGNHVIQKVIECVPTPRITHILDAFLACILPLSGHPFGCRIVQRILEHCKDPMRRGAALDEILKGTHKLILDQYGNYVIQQLLQCGSTPERVHIVGVIAPGIQRLALHKFASNVIEKGLTYCDTRERDTLIWGILGHGRPVPEGEPDPLQAMMKDQFGNYVVQKVLAVANPEQRDVLLSRMQPHLSALKKYTYGKHIAARAEKLLVAAGAQRGGGGAAGGGGAPSAPSSGEHASTAGGEPLSSRGQGPSAP
uniref:PUM-HD domain-containing protein n=1 Tax=Chlamydomonas euryale TaxID=1486919 RepID=A0A7R9YUU0_9CHLO